MTFKLGQILTITTERLCCDMDELYEILNHMTGDNLFTHVLPRAGRWAKPLILELYPELEAVNTAEWFQELNDAIVSAATPMDGVNSWMAKLNLPPEYSVPCYSDRWLSLDPIAELEGMVGKERIIAVTAGGCD